MTAPARHSTIGRLSSTAVLVTSLWIMGGCPHVHLSDPCPSLELAAAHGTSTEMAQSVFDEAAFPHGEVFLIPVAIRSPQCGLYLDVLVGVHGAPRDARFTAEYLSKFAAAEGAEFEHDCQERIALTSNGQIIPLREPELLVQKGVYLSSPLLPPSIADSVYYPPVARLQTDVGMALLVSVRLRTDTALMPGAAQCELFKSSIEWESEPSYLLPPGPVTVPVVAMGSVASQSHASPSTQAAQPTNFATAQTPVTDYTVLRVHRQVAPRSP